jgi:hypothetical protein
MARVMIVFEDVQEVRDDGRVVSIDLHGDRMYDCQDEPTPAELSAKTFYEFLLAASSQEIDTHSE